MLAALNILATKKMGNTDLLDAGNTPIKCLLTFAVVVTSSGTSESSSMRSFSMTNNEIFDAADKIKNVCFSNALSMIR